MSQTHHGKVAIVTGARGGLGKPMVRGLLSSGASVVAVDIGEVDQASDGFLNLAIGSCRYHST